MKRKIFSVLLFASVLLVASCSDNNDTVDDLKGATLSVTIAGQAAPRYVGPSSPNPTIESLVTNFTVIVFNFHTGDMERVQSFTVNNNANYTRQITGLSTGTDKRIVAFVNVPNGVDFSSVATYSDLSTNMITLDSQNAPNIAATGLFMSGETTEAIRLVSNGDNTVNIPVSRRVAKVILEDLIIDPDVAADLPLFTLTGVSIQKARLIATPINGLVPPGGDDTTNYAGGIASPTGARPNFNLTRDYLFETLTLPAGYTAGTNIITNQNQERYFYILPNDGLNNHATLLTITGTYGSDPEDVYYPFEINSVAGQGDSDGNYIQSNMIYGLSATIHRLNLPSEDPNVVPSDVVLDITITPQDWALRINQPVEW